MDRLADRRAAARVADAGGTAIADRVEVERLQIGIAARLQVLSHHLAAGAMLVFTTASRPNRAHCLSPRGP